MAGKGFFGSLFDFSFENFVFPKIVRIFRRNCSSLSPSSLLYCLRKFKENVTTLVKRRFVLSR